MFIPISDTLIPYAVMATGAANAMLCLRIVSLLMQISKKWYKRAILFVGCYLLGGMIIFVGDPINLPPTLISFVFAILFCCEDGLYKKMALSLILCSTTLSFNALCDSYLRDITYLPRLLYWLLLLFLISKIAPKNTFNLSKTYWKLIMLLTLTPLGIVLSLVLLQSPDSLDSHYPYLSNLILLILSSLSLIGLIWTITILARQQKLEEDHYLLEINQNYYKNMEQQQFEIRRLRHDMANHLQTLSSLPPEKVSDYLSSLTKDNAFYGIKIFCGNTTVNAILNTKYALMIERNIAFEYHIEMKDNLPFSPTDICALFSNFMDNAIEACEKIGVPQPKIVLSAKTGKGLLAIQIKNSCLKPQTVTHTTKKDALNHGYGLKSIREIVERYHGNMEIEQTNDLFTLFLYLPLS